jgi:hypothetical protein
MDLQDALKSAKAVRKERLREIENQRSAWLEQEHERLEQGRSGAPGSDERHALRVERAKEKIDAWHRRQLERVEQHYRSKVERAREKDLAKRAHRWMGRRPGEERRSERRPTERRPTERRSERRPTERRPTERRPTDRRAHRGPKEPKETKETRRNYQAVRRAIAQYCQGVKGALSPRAAECIEHIFFRPGRRHRLGRWLRGQAANICDLSESEYEQLRDQKVLPVDERGLVGDPVPGADCSNRAVTGAKPPPPATWIQWGHNVVQLAGATAALPYHAGRLARAPLSTPLAVLRKINPLLIVPLPRPITAGVSLAGDLVARYALMSMPASGAVLLALDGLYLAMAMAPKYSSFDECRGTTQLHAVPARFMLQGGIISSLISGIVFGALMTMTTGQTGLSVPIVGEKIRQAMEHASKKEGLGRMTTALTLGAALAAARGVGGHSVVAGLAATLRNVVYGTLFKMKEGGWFTDSRLAKMLAAFIHTATGGKIADVTEVMNVLAEVASLGTAAVGLEEIAQLGPTKTALSGEADAVQDFIKKATDQVARLVVSEDGKLEEGARSRLYDFYRGWFVDPAVSTFADATGVPKAAYQKAHDAYSFLSSGMTPEGAAAQVGSLTNLLPPFFAGGVFAGLFVKLKESLDCKMAVWLYERDQAARHGDKVRASYIGK